MNHLDRAILKKPTVQAFMLDPFVIIEPSLAKHDDILPGHPTFKFLECEEEN